MGCCESRTLTPNDNLSMCLQRYSGITGLRLVGIPTIKSVASNLPAPSLSKTQFELVTMNYRINLSWMLLCRANRILTSEFIYTLLIICGAKDEDKQEFLTSYVGSDPRRIAHYLEWYYELLYLRIPLHAVNLKLLPACDTIYYINSQRVVVGGLLVSNMQALASGRCTFQSLNLVSIS